MINYDDPAETDRQLHQNKQNLEMIPVFIKKAPSEQYIKINSRENNTEYNQIALNYQTNNSEENFDETKITSIKSCNSYFISINTSIGFFFMGYHLGAYNTIQNNITKILGWENDQVTTLISFCSCLIPLGALFGSIISGKIASSALGRRGSLILFNIIGLLGSLISIIGNTPTFIIGRFIMGMICGAFSTVVPLYIKEFLPLSTQGKGGMINNFFFCVGVLISFLLALNIPQDVNNIEDSWWRFIMIFPSIVGVINVFIYFFVLKKDTPKFLIIKKNDEESARVALNYVYSNKKNIDNLIKNLQNIRKFMLESKDKYDVTLKDLFGKKYSIRFIIAILLNIGQQTTALNVITSYSNMIYLKYEPEINATLFSGYFGISEVVGNILAIFLIEKMGRKKLLILGFASVFLCLLSISILYYKTVHWPQKFIIIIYFFFAGVSVDPLIWIINADFLPDFGVGICAMVNWITAIIVIISFPYMNNVIDLSGVFLFYSCFTLTIIIFMIVFFKETKNKNDIELAEIYSRWF